MPNRNGTGPRKRSPRPGKRMGGLRRGGCATTRRIGRGRRRRRSR